MAHNTVRLASIGLGSWGGKLAEAAGATGDVQIVSCFARTAETRDEFARRFGCEAAPSLDAVLGNDDIDGVLVSTPHSTHLELIDAAASAGKHVFVEKPLALTVADAQRAIDAASRAGVTLQVGHRRRRQPATRRLRALVDSGELGLVSLLEANQSGPRGLDPRTGWRSDPAESPLGSMTGMGVHMADNLIYLAGPAVAVTTLSRQTLGRSPLDDVTVIGVEFASGALGSIGTSYVVPKNTTTVVFGSEGTAWSEEEGRRLFRQGIDEAVRTEVAVDGPDSVIDQMREFARCVRTGSTPEVGGSQALEVVALLEAAVLSAERRRTVELSEIRSNHG